MQYSIRLTLLMGFVSSTVTLSTLSTGCKTPTRSEDDRYRGTFPTSRTKEREKPVVAKPIDRPAEQPLLAPPQPEERPIVPVDFQKPSQPLTLASAESDGTPPRIIERIRERREERKQPPVVQAPAPSDIPTLPSPFEKDKKPEAPSPVAPAPKSSQPAQPIQPVQPIAKTTPATGLDDVKRIYQLCKQKWDGLKDYEAKLVRKEVIGGKEQPTEEMIFQFRKQPYSVHTKNIGANGRGREVIFVEAGKNSKMHILTGEGDNRLLGAGFYTAMSPDDRMVTSKSRHKISEGAIGRTVDMLGLAIGKAERGEFNGLKSTGQVKRKEYTQALECIEAMLPAGSDPELPKGGRREVYFDADPKSPSYGLPVLLRLVEGERELEYYCFTDFKIPANLTDADFDPTKLSKRR